MNQFNKDNSVTIRAFATLEFRDAETDELLRTVTEENSLTQYTDLYLSGRTYGYAYGITYDLDTNPGYECGPLINNSAESTFPCITAAEISSKSYAIWTKPATYIVPSSVQQVWTEISTNTDINNYITPASVITKRVRFNQPATTTIIKSIFLRGNQNNYASYNPAASWISLSTPCSQLPSEVLDITYRIELYNTPGSRLVNNADVLWTTPEYNPAIAKSKWWRYQGNATTWDYNETVDIHAIVPLWYKHPEYADAYYALCSPGMYGTEATHLPTLASSAGAFNSYPISTFITRYNSTTVTATSAWTESAHVGKLARFGGIFRGYGERQSDPNYTLSLQLYGWTDFLPKNFTHKPVQPIHNHSELAPKPFVDVDYLASGAGAITVDTGTWTEHNGLLEWWRCNIKNTGQTGTARYHIARNIRGEFAGNTYGVASRAQDSIPILTNGENYLTGLSTVNGGIEVGAPIMIDSHYRGHRQNVVEWSDTKHVIAHDESGITIMNLVTQDYKNFDATTTPALPVSSINQITTLANGDVYVADTVSGLWRIQDILGTPVITSVVCSELNIDDNKCYAVSEGYNNSIWAVYDGGLAHTTNSGSSWTTYTVQNGGWVHSASSAPEEIGASNWDTVKMLRVDVESPLHKLGIVRSSTLYTAMLVWWQPTLTAIDFNKSNTYANAYFTQLVAGGRARTNFFKCSRRGGMWAMLNMSTTLLYCLAVYILTHNSSYSRITSNSSYQTAYWPMIQEASQPLKGVCFLYDNNNKPYYTLGQGLLNTHYHPGSTKMYTDSGYTPALFVSRVSSGDASYGTGGEAYFAYRAENILFSFERAAVDLNYKGPVVIGGNSRAGGNFTTISPTNVYYDQTAYYVDTSSPVTDNWLGRHVPTRDMNWNEYRWNGSAWVDGWHDSLTDLTAFNNNGIRAGFECESHYFRGRSRIDFDSVITEDFSNGLTMVGTFDCDAARPLGQSKRHTMFSTDRFHVGRRDSDDTVTPGIIELKDKNFTNAIYGSVVANDNTRYVISVSSVPNDSYDFKADPSTRNSQGVFMRPVSDDIIGVLGTSTAYATGSEYHTIYSPVYSEIDNGDFAIQFDLNIPTTAGPGRGVRIGARYGDKAFTPISDTYAATGTAPTGDILGFRSPSTYSVYFAGGTTAPAFWNQSTVLTATVNSAITANDQNGVNKLEIRYTIVGADLVIKVVRIALAGTPVTNILYTCTVAGAGTLHAGKPGIIGITPEHTTAVATATNAPQLTNFVLYDYTTTTPFGKTAYTSTVNVYADGNTTPVLSYSVGTAEPLNVPTKLWCGFESHSLHRGFWGTLANPQVWNVAWNTTDVAADFAALTGTSVINTANAPTANCKARYDMSETLLETKATHTGVQAGPSGMDLSFANLTADGVTSYAFTDSDFYTWGMFDGILKDNAITANFSATWFKGCNADLEYTKLVPLTSNTVLASTIPSITATPVTEVAVFTSTHAFYGPGFLAYGTNAATGVNYYRGITAQSLPDSTDGYFEAGINMRQAFFIGLQTNIDGSAYPANSNATTGAFVQLNLDGSYVCKVNNVAVFTSAADAYVMEDRFKIARVDSATTPAFKFYLNDVEVASTTTGVQTAELAPMVVAGVANPCGVHEAVVNYVRDFPSLEAGQYNLTESLRSGRYAPGFLMLHPDATMYDIEIDALPAIVLFSSADTISSLPLPAAIPSGTVYILAKLGILAFSSSDVGKSITMNKAPMLYWK